MWATQCISSGRVTHLLGNYTPSHSVWLTTVRALYPLPLLTTCLPSLQFALYETGCEETNFATYSHVPACFQGSFHTNDGAVRGVAPIDLNVASHVTSITDIKWLCRNTVCPHWKPLITWSTRLCAFARDNSVSVIKTEAGTRHHGNIIFNMTDKTQDYNTVTPPHLENAAWALSLDEMWKWNALPTESSGVLGTSITSCTFGPVSFTDNRSHTHSYPRPV